MKYPADEPTDYIIEGGDPFFAEDLIEIFKAHPKFKLRVSAMTDENDHLYGTSEGEVNRVVVVPARDEIVLYSDFGNLEEPS